MLQGKRGRKKVGVEKALSVSWRTFRNFSSSSSSSSLSRLFAAWLERGRNGAFFGEAFFMVHELCFSEKLWPNVVDGQFGFLGLEEKLVKTARP